MELGKTYKIIRKNKNLTQKEICQERVTTVTLSKFENGKLTPSFVLMSYFLNQINMSFEEFLFLCSFDELTEEKKILIAFESVTSNMEITKIRRLLKILEPYSMQESNGTHEQMKEIRKILLLILEVEKNGFSQKAEMMGLEIWNKIIVKKEWYITDLRMINLILFYFPSEKVYDIVDRLLDRLEEYTGLGEFAALKTSTLINLSAVYINSKLFNSAQKILYSALRESKKLKRYDFTAVCLVRLGVLISDEESIATGKKLLHLVNETELEDELSREVLHLQRLMKENKETFAT